MWRQRTDLVPWLAAFLLAAGLPPALRGENALRNLHVGAPMPEFSLADAGGTVFRYGPERSGVLGLVLLQAKQANLERLAADLGTLTQTLKAQRGPFDCVGVLTGPGGKEYLRSLAPGVQKAFPLLLDPNFVLWGKLGAIAAPTALVVGSDHKIHWVKAGYGYSFLAEFHAQLAQALGREGSPAQSSAGQDPTTAGAASVRVETLQNDSARARRDRRIQLARMLAKKGRRDTAIQELETLHQSEPNALDVTLELGEMLCQAGQNEAALKLVSGLKAESQQDKAHALWVCGRARRQMADLATAETLLTQAWELDRESPRTLYELGRLYQAKGDATKALDCYRQALAGVFGDTDVNGGSQK